MEASLMKGRRQVVSIAARARGCGEGLRRSVVRPQGPLTLPNLTIRMRFALKISGGTVSPRPSFLRHLQVYPRATESMTMRKTMIATAGLIAFLGLSGAASAEETVVRSESSPSVTVEKRDDVVERRSVTTDCGSKTVHKEDSAGNSKTVHKEGC